MYTAIEFIGNTRYATNYVELSADACRNYILALPSESTNWVVKFASPD